MTLYLSDRINNGTVQPPVEMTAYPGLHQFHNEFSLSITTWKFHSELLFTKIWHFHPV